MSRYHRIAHMKDTPVVKLNQWVHRGDLIGYCGSTGNSSGPHAHYDCPVVDLKKVFGSWRQYVYGWSHSRVQATFDDPKQFCKGNYPMQAEFPLVGYNYLQGIRDPRNGVYFHSGEDLNGVNDIGKPIYAPVEGRVVWVEGMTKLGKVFPKSLNGGWGCYVVIEEKPGFVMP